MNSSITVEPNLSPEELHAQIKDKVEHWEKALTKKENCRVHGAMDWALEDSI